MKKEHFDYISQKFDIELFHSSNVWIEDQDLYMNPLDLTVCRTGSKTWSIVDEHSVLISQIPSQILAEEIIEHIQKTEILFI